jgi:anaerobic magnesium-protoporphyrin IX monomethyl ester cyclase
MHLYGRGSRNHPALVAVEHGRGCVDSCRFCILWKQMGKAVRDNGSFRVVPFYRTKSARRSAEEVLWLAKRFGRKTIAWVDATWNADPGWSEEFCDRIIASGMKVQMLAWMRADAVVRDEAAGILARQVRAGLVQAMIGVERASGDEVAALGKHSSGPDVAREAFRILRRNYPSVYTIGTMIYGTPDETPARLKRALKATYELGMDYPLFVPLTPNPGTDLWDDAGTQRRIARRDFRLFNFHTPVMDAEGMSAEELEWFYVKLGLDPSPGRPLGIVRGIFGSPARRRSVHRALFCHACEVLWRAAAARIRRRGNGHSPSLYAVKPKWYES